MTLRPMVHSWGALALAVALLSACQDGSGGDEASVRNRLDRIQQHTDEEARDVVEAVERSLGGQLTYNRMAFGTCTEDWLGNVDYSGKFQLEAEKSFDNGRVDEIRDRLAELGWTLERPEPVRKDVPRSERSQGIAGKKGDLRLSLLLGPIGIADLTVSHPCVETSKDVAQEYRTKDHTLDR